MATTRGDGGGSSPKPKAKWYPVPKGTKGNVRKVRVHNDEKPGRPMVTAYMKSRTPRGTGGKKKP